MKRKKWRCSAKTESAAMKGEKDGKHAEGRAGEHPADRHEDTAGSARMLPQHGGEDWNGSRSPDPAWEHGPLESEGHQFVPRKFEGRKTMTVKDLLETALIKDTDKVCIKMMVGADKKTITSGNWFQDQVLNMMDQEVSGFAFEHGYLWTIYVKSKQ